MYTKKGYMTSHPHSKSHNVLIGSEDSLPPPKHMKTKKTKSHKNKTYTHIHKLTLYPKTQSHPINNKTTHIYKTNTTKHKYIQIQQHHQSQNTNMHKNNKGGHSHQSAQQYPKFHLKVDHQQKHNLISTTKHNIISTTKQKQKERK